MKQQSHRSYPQNPIIATTLYKTGFLESWGTGVSRMVEACKAVGLPEPQYGTDGLFVWITFMRPSLDSDSDSNPDTSSDTSSDTNSDTERLSDRQKAVLDYCMVPRSSREILAHINVTYQNKNIIKFIKSLVDAGFLERTIPESPNSPKQQYIARKQK
jgi:ATP-dependent DNA helicase RecG